MRCRKNIRKYERVISYINAVQEDVLENISQFVEEEEDGEDSLASLLPMLGKKPAEDVTLKYKVNSDCRPFRQQGCCPSW